MMNCLVTIIFLDFALLYNVIIVSLFLKSQ